MKNKIVISNEELNKLNKNIIQYKDDFNSLLDKIRLMTMELEKYYNTPTGNEIREVMINYIDKQKEYVSNRYLSLSETLKSIIGYYETLYADIEKRVNKK